MKRSFLFLAVSLCTGSFPYSHAQTCQGGKIDCAKENKTDVESLACLCGDPKNLCHPSGPEERFDGYFQIRKDELTQVNDRLKNFEEKCDDKDKNRQCIHLSALKKTMNQELKSCEHACVQFASQNETCAKALPKHIPGGDCDTMAENKECNSLMLSDEDFDCDGYQGAAQRWYDAKAEESRLLAEKQKLSKCLLSRISESFTCKISLKNAEAMFLNRETASVNCLQVMVNSCKSTLGFALKAQNQAVSNFERTPATAKSH